VKKNQQAKNNIDLKILKNGFLPYQSNIVIALENSLYIIG